MVSPLVECLRDRILRGPKKTAKKTYNNNLAEFHAKRCPPSYVALDNKIPCQGIAMHLKILTNRAKMKLSKSSR